MSSLENRPINGCLWSATLAQLVAALSNGLHVDVGAIRHLRQLHLTVVTVRPQSYHHWGFGAVAPEPAVVARKGGDEFASLFSHASALFVRCLLPTAIAVRVIVYNGAIGGPFELSHSAFFHYQFDLDAFCRFQGIAYLISPIGDGRLFCCGWVWRHGNDFGGAHTGFGYHGGRWLHDRLDWQDRCYPDHCSDGGKMCFDPCKALKDLLVDDGYCRRLGCTV